MHVLLAIANPRMSERIKHELEKQQYAVVELDRPYDVLATALRAGFDLLLLDAETDPNGGATLCRRLREAGVQTKIIVLSATGSAAEAAQTINAGADDVVPASVATPELLARVRALGRRDSGVWPNERDYKSNIVDVFVHYLRNKIERRGEAKLIQTVPGVGYMLKA
jgi:DNA-binding response OmpR family regulator